MILAFADAIVYSAVVLFFLFFFPFSCSNVFFFLLLFQMFVGMTIGWDGWLRFIHLTDLYDTVGGTRNSRDGYPPCIYSGLDRRRRMLVYQLLFSFLSSFFAFGRCWLDIRGICRSRLCCATACLARGGIWQHSNDSLQIRRYLSLSLMFRDESEGDDL